MVLTISVMANRTRPAAISADNPTDCGSANDPKSSAMVAEIDVAPWSSMW
jgi:hypothetical protein